MTTRGRELLAGAGVTVAVAALGLGMAQLWRAVAPRTEVVRVEQGYVYASAAPEQPVAGDGWFAILGFGAGVVLAVLAWTLLRRYRGVVVLVGLVLGSLAGAWLAWWLGVRLEVAHFEAIRDTLTVGQHAHAPLSLRVTDLTRADYWPPKVTGVVAVQALAAALTYTAIAGFAVDPDLRWPPRDPDDEDEPAPTVSSGQAGPFSSGPAGP